MRTGKLEKSGRDRPMIITKGSRAALLEFQGQAGLGGWGLPLEGVLPEREEGISEQEQTSVRGLASQLV